MYRVKKERLYGWFSLVLGIVLLVAGLGYLHVAESSGLRIALIVLGIVSVACSYIVCFRDFAFDKTGVYVKHPFFEEHFYDWDCFQDITVYFPHGTNVPQAYFVKKGMWKSPLTGNWPIYGEFLFKIYVVPFDADMIRALRRSCPFDLPSYGTE